MRDALKLHANRNRQRHADYDFVHIGPNQVLVRKLNRFADTWPCTGLRLDAGIIFTFAGNGDLVDLEWFDAETGKTINEPEYVDGQAVLALSHDAQEFLKSKKDETAE